MRPVVYLAGPDVFRPDAAARGALLKAICDRVGLAGLFPADSEISGGCDPARAIRDANMAMIASCDALVANMTPFRGVSMDPGTAYEMGVAAALAKPVIGWTDDPRSLVGRASQLPGAGRDADGRLRDGEGMLVEEFDRPLADNLMMACGAVAILDSAEAAIAHAASLLGARAATD